MREFVFALFAALVAAGIIAVLGVGSLIWAICIFFAVCFVWPQKRSDEHEPKKPVSRKERRRKRHLDTAYCVFKFVVSFVILLIVMARALSTDEARIAAEHGRDALQLQLLYWAAIVMLIVMVGRFIETAAFKVFTPVPRLWLVTRCEFFVAVALMANNSLLLVPVRHRHLALGGLSAAVDMVCLVVLVFFWFWRRDLLRRRGVDPMKKKVAGIVQSILPMNLDTFWKACIDASIVVLAWVATLTVPIAIASASVLSAVVVTQPPLAVQTAPQAPLIYFPLASPSPAASSLGSIGYERDCGADAAEQPGYNTSGEIEVEFIGLWEGFDIGLGANLAGCWGEYPEIVAGPHGEQVEYDTGGVNGNPVSLAIATSDGESEIYLQDGGREALAQSLLERHLLITGSPRFDVFNGDVQLVYTPFGTIASVRDEEHPTGQPDVSSAAVNLLEPETNAWVKEMNQSHEWLWPTIVTTGATCLGEVSMAPTYGQAVARVCPGPITKSGEPSQAELFRVGAPPSTVDAGGDVSQSRLQSIAAASPS